MTIKPGPVNTAMTAHMKIRKADVNKVAATIVKAIDKRVQPRLRPRLTPNRAESYTRKCPPMRTLAFLSVVFALSLSSQTAAQPAPPACPPKSDTLTARTVTTAELLPSPGLLHPPPPPRGGQSPARSCHQGGGGEEAELLLGVLDITAPCLVTQVEATVPNGQQVGIQLLAAADDVCTATPTFKSDPKPDYISTIISFLKPAPFLLPEKSHSYRDRQAARTTAPLSSAGRQRNHDGCHRLQAEIGRAAPAGLKVPADTHGRRSLQGPATVLRLRWNAGLALWQARLQRLPHRRPASTPPGVATTQNTISLTTSSVQLVPHRVPQHLHLRHKPPSSGPAGRPGHQPQRQQERGGVLLRSGPHIHGICFAPGLRIARASFLGGGFSLGEVIPSGVTPPVNYRTTYRFAFAISYSPPVKGGS